MRMFTSYVTMKWLHVWKQNFLTNCFLLPFSANAIYKCLQIEVKDSKLFFTEKLDESDKIQAGKFDFYLNLTEVYDFKLSEFAESSLKSLRKATERSL